MSQAVDDAFHPTLAAFLQLGQSNADMGDANVAAHSIDPNASIAQKSFIIQVINSSKTDAAREGGKLAFCHIFGAKSFKEAEEEVLEQLATL